MHGDADPASRCPGLVAQLRIELVQLVEQDPGTGDVAGRAAVPVTVASMPGAAGAIAGDRRPLDPFMDFLRHVACRVPWMPELIGDRIDFVVAPTPTVLPQLRAGRLRAQATLTETRLELPGDPPTIAELGWPGQVFRGGLFLFAAHALARWSGDLNDWFREIVSLPDIVRWFQENAIEPLPFDLDERAHTVRQRLEIVDAMRVATLGRGR